MNDFRFTIMGIRNGEAEVVNRIQKSKTDLDGLYCFYSGFTGDCLG